MPIMQFLQLVVAMQFQHFGFFSAAVGVQSVFWAMDKTGIEFDCMCYSVYLCMFSRLVYVVVCVVQSILACCYHNFTVS